MIYENESRGTVWESGPEQTAAIERRQRKQSSHVGLAVTAFMLITPAARVAVMVLAGPFSSLLGGFIDFYGFTGRMSTLPLSMYSVVFLVAAGLLQSVPKCGPPQKEQWGFWKFVSFSATVVRIGLTGNILGRSVGILRLSGPDFALLDQLIESSSPWVNLLTTVIMAPVVEELSFRKPIMDRLLGYGQKAAIIMSGIIFGMIHSNFSQFFYAFGIGTPWAYVYTKIGKVGHTIGFHILFNLLGGVITVELPKGVQRLAEGPWIIRQVESIPGINMGWLVTVFSSATILAYFFLMLVCLTAVVTPIIVYRRQATFRSGQ